MAVPKYSEMYKAFLELLLDEEIHTKVQEKAHIINKFNLTVEDVAEIVASGTQSVINSRIGWCSTYLKKAGLIESPSRGSYKITDKGIQVYNDNGVIDNTTLSQFETFVEFVGRNTNTIEFNNINVNLINEDIPQEIFEKVYVELNNKLADDLLMEVREMNAYRFEALVVNLLVKMGYGKLAYGSTTTKKSNDEGIDGVIKSDKLGFESIYIQAKRFKEGNVVGRPEVQKFVGALAGQGAQKGAFITASTFTQEAIEYVKKINNYKVVLINGMQLAELMIEYELGISTVKTYNIKQIDSDYFCEE